MTTLVVVEPWEGCWLARVCVRRAGRMRVIGAFAGSWELVRRVTSVASLNREVSIAGLVDLANEIKASEPGLVVERSPFGGAA